MSEHPRACCRTTSGTTERAPEELDWRGFGFGVSPC
jgi:hypothetical protein